MHLLLVFVLKKLALASSTDSYCLIAVKLVLCNSVVIPNLRSFILDANQKSQT